MAKAMVIDSIAFARLGHELSGTLQVGSCNRLGQGLPLPQPGTVVWSLAGRIEPGTGGAWLDVRAQGAVRVVCQRCLQPLDLELRVSRSLGLAESQAQLDALDALDAEGPGPDAEYMLADPHLEVLDLIEDELILAMPFAPRHEQCPGPAPDGVPAGAPEASPFAVLAALKHGKH
ncbi:MAG: YceD family protein [Castellaniella sp.]